MSLGTRQKIRALLTGLVRQVVLLPVGWSEESPTWSEEWTTGSSPVFAYVV